MTAVPQTIDAAPQADPVFESPAFGGSRFKPLLILGAILVVGLGLRCWELGAPPFWLDEFLTVELSSGHGFTHLDLPRQSVVESPPDFAHLRGALPITSIWTNSTYDVHPPLYYIVLRLWREVISNSDYGIRMLSVVCSLAAIILLYCAVRITSGTVPALWAATLMAVAGPQIQMSQFNRSYMLLLALLLGTALALLRIERLGFHWRRAAALGLCAYGSAMTHYLGITILIVLGGYVLIRFRDKSRWQTFGILCLVGAVYVGTWGPFALAQHRSGFDQRIDFVARKSDSPLDTLIVAATLPLRYFTNARPQTQVVGILGGALFVLPALLLRQRRDLLLWWMWLCGGVGFVLVGDLLRERQMMYWIRYTLAASPAAYAIAAIILAHLRGWSRHVVPLALSIAALISVQSAYDHPPGDWRGLGRFIDANFRDGDLLVLDDGDPEQWRVRAYLVGMNYYAQKMPMPIAIVSEPADNTIRQRINAAKRVWYFMLHGRGSLYTRTLPDFEAKSDAAPFPYIGILQVIGPASQPSPSTQPETPR